ncbi:hypothetical protein [Gimesia maris]|uniref:hypothetical protein n=1 Tax=Gimesia maris TaxID=122 RepID=UPI0032EDEDC6
MKTGTDEHLKFKQLQLLLGVPKFAAIGVLESLWHMACRNAPEGNIGKYTNAMIASGMEWDGDSDFLIQCLIDSGFVDEVEDGNRLVIHDWEEHCPDFIKKRLRRKASAGGGQRQTTADSGDQRQPTGANGAITQPNPTQPNPTKPENAQSSDCSPSLPNEDQLDSLIDSWNQLPQGIAPKVSERRSDPIVTGWRKVQRTPALKTGFKDIPLLMTRIRDGTFLHGNGWFRFVWLFGKKNSQWNVLKILEGNYDRGKQGGNARDPARVRSSEDSHKLFE